MGGGENRPRVAAAQGGIDLGDHLRLGERILDPGVAGVEQRRGARPRQLLDRAEEPGPLRKRAAVRSIATATEPKGADSLKTSRTR